MDNNTAMTIGELVYELNEAKAELARHHRDFERISTVLDMFENNYNLGNGAATDVAFGIATVRAIRKIVG